MSKSIEEKEVARQRKVALKAKSELSKAIAVIHKRSVASKGEWNAFYEALDELTSEVFSLGVAFQLWQSCEVERSLTACP